MSLKRKANEENGESVKCLKRDQTTVVPGELPKDQ